jgi:hypothetical protein
LEGFHAQGKEIQVRTETDLRSPAKKEAVSGNCSEQDDCASGLAWFAREPELMCGAEGRASSQRSIDYHSPPRFCQRKNQGSEKALQLCRSAGPGTLAFRLLGLL